MIFVPALSSGPQSKLLGATHFLLMVYWLYQSILLVSGLLWKGPAGPSSGGLVLLWIFIQQLLV